jgi:hypothetical protein
MRHDIEAIREWHKAEEDYYQQPGNPEGTWKMAHADRGTLIRALDEAQAKVKRLEEALRLGKIVMDMLEEHGPSIVPHLLDTDENAGQRFRDALARAALEQTP